MLADVKTKQLFLTIGSKAIAIHSSFKNHSNRNLHSKSTTTANEKTADRLFVWWKIIAMGKVGSSDLLVALFPSQSFQTNSAFPGYSPFWKTDWIEGLFFSTVSQRLPDLAVTHCKKECISEESISHHERLGPSLSVGHKGEAILLVWARLTLCISLEGKHSSSTECDSSVLPLTVQFWRHSALTEPNERFGSSIRFWFMLLAGWNMVISVHLCLKNVLAGCTSQSCSRSWPGQGAGEGFKVVEGMWVVNTACSQVTWQHPASASSAAMAPEKSCLVSGFWVAQWWPPCSVKGLYRQTHQLLAVGLVVGLETQVGTKRDKAFMLYKKCWKELEGTLSPPLKTHFFLVIVLQSSASVCS